ncbi:MAG: EF-hand domain-containing protein, partial [Vitreoscilla sp.]|nr:EF-hand domain-containing protein [Polaromonas sp.]
AAAVLIATGAQAQTEVPVDATSAASAPASAASATSLVAPRYSARDVERAFGFIDANKDGKISREEASGFRNVAKYFDAADVNKDGALSLEEFGSALNRP